jgi:S-DNA-T family DNA segregation ATPase FtsK/SpoIIIE
MSNPLSIPVQRELIAELHRLAAERDAAEKRVEAEFRARNAAAEKEFAAAKDDIGKRFKLDLDATQKEFDQALAKAKSDYATQHEQFENELTETRERVLDRYNTREQEAIKQLEQDTWQATTVFEATHPGLLEQFNRVEARVNANVESLKVVAEDARQHLEVCRQPAAWESASVEDLPADGPDPFKELSDRAASANSRLTELRRLISPKFGIGVRRQVLGVVIFVVMMAVSLPLMKLNVWYWLGVGAFVSGLLIALVLIWLYHLGRMQAGSVCGAIRQDIADAEKYKERCHVEAKAYYEAQRAKMAKQHRHEIRKANERHLARMTELTSDRDGAVAEAEETYNRREIQLVERRDKLLSEAQQKYPVVLADIRSRHDRQQFDVKSKHDRILRESRSRHDTEWNALAAKWRDGMRQLYDGVAGMNAESDKLFPAWDDPAWKDWTPPMAPPPAVRFGDYSLRLDQVPGGISSDPRLMPDGPTVISLPALLPFPHNASISIKAAGEGRLAAVHVLRAVMLRMLATIPPGKLRFTIIDPVGLGENFAGFMHLADFDDILVTNRIWTEPQQIETRLADLTEQMENVIQKYLRNDFQTIAEYNEFAGEVAEAFRVLVVANFPVNFTESAARRLTSIAASGARCGVYVLMTTDTNQSLPMRFDLKDVESHATNLTWENGRFIWKESDFGKFPLSVDLPPPEERFTQIVQLVGENAKDSRRVEVPFEYIAPADDKWWSGSTSHGINVALGRAGATKLQHLRLGHGTSQHVLVAGKTGSGKSTLLHALVTNLALTYSPAEIELYLIDFKKGVEFKTYSTHELPHARVIAIESEREFGLSVLQKLDGVLRERGDLFRRVGVQDLASFRQAEPQTTLPRILLVVDEFQELFVEDDKIAQEAALLLDRLVRQGRAFGMHVLLGSQTLGGAYSLARSTIGQMAVRIALQCSENDAHLILSEDNSAARLLTRPGEAIYNDANGMVIGNNPFQVVWLSDERREVYLEGIRERARRHDPPFIPRQIVFEGNVPADVSRNHLLSDLIAAGSWEDAGGAPAAWLGEAIAIKDPTAALFRQQNGCNLLLIGQRDESARAIMASALVSLSAQQIPAENQSLNGRRHSAEARFYVLEPARSSEQAGPTVGELAKLLPHPIHIAGRRDVPALMAELAEEVERRHSAERVDAPAIYLFVFDLARFRDLRRGEDFGYSFGSEPKKANPGQQFADILREGPGVGVHTIAWCDTLNNLQRAIDRQGMREFDLRVLFQMSGGDSSQLIDTPLASKLGPNLALFYNEEDARVEKFRPYAWPAESWLAWVQERLQARASSQSAASEPADRAEASETGN